MLLESFPFREKDGSQAIIAPNPGGWWEEALLSAPSRQNRNASEESARHPSIRARSISGLRGRDQGREENWSSLWSTEFWDGMGGLQRRRVLHLVK